MFQQQVDNFDCCTKKCTMETTSYIMRVDSNPFQSTTLSNVGKVEGRVVTCDLELLNIFPLEFNHLRLQEANNACSQ